MELARTIVLAYLCSIGSASALAQVFRHELAGFDPGIAGKGFFESIVYIAVLGPLLETLAMGAMLSLFLWRQRTPFAAILVTSLLFAAVHGAFNPYWGLIAFSSFAVFSFIYVRFLRYGVRWAAMAAFCVHALQNLTGLIS